MKTILAQILGAIVVIAVAFAEETTTVDETTSGNITMINVDRGISYLPNPVCDWWTYRFQASACNGYGDDIGQCYPTDSCRKADARGLCNKGLVCCVSRVVDRKGPQTPKRQPPTRKPRYPQEWPRKRLPDLPRKRLPEIPGGNFPNDWPRKPLPDIPRKRLPDLPTPRDFPRRDLPPGRNLPRDVPRRRFPASSSGSSEYFMMANGNNDKVNLSENDY